MGCGLITRGSVPVCADDGTPLKSGSMPRLILFNLDELLSVTESSSTPNLLTAITLATNTVGYVFEGYKQDVKPSQEFIVPGNGGTMFKHAVNFIVYDITQLQKNNIQRMAKGKYLAIVENKGKNDESFEVYGIGSGMEIVPGVARDSYANGGGYLLSLATPEGESEPMLPQTLWTTDYATTLTLVNGYAAQPTVTNISDLALQVAGGDTETITGTYFYGGGSSSAVLSVKWVNQVTGAMTTQTSVTVASNTSITFTSVALVAGSYRLRVTTTRGVTDSTQVAIAS
jgi:IPT/TIG domain